MKNHAIMDTFAALKAINQMSLPPLVSLRVGRNLASLTEIVKVLEDKRMQLIAENKVGPDHTMDKEYGDRLREFEKGYKEILEDDSKWEPVIKIPFKLVENAKEFSHAAQLIAAGILTEE